MNIVLFFNNSLMLITYNIYRHRQEYSYDNERINRTRMALGRINEEA